MEATTARPVRPQPNRPGPQPTIVRVQTDSRLFRGWGVSI
jgi:hypothetical protein